MPSNANATPKGNNTIGTIVLVKTIMGAGVDLAVPIYSTWAAYDKAIGVAGACASIGPGGGVAAYRANTVNFGDRGVGMLPHEITAAKDSPALQICLVPRAVVPTGNLPRIGTWLKVTGSKPGEMYARKLMSSDDPALKKPNPGVALLNMPFVAEQRSPTLAIEGLMRQPARELTVAIGNHNIRQAERASGVTVFTTSNGPVQLVRVAATKELFSRPAEQATVGHLVGKVG